MFHPEVFVQQKEVEVSQTQNYYCCMTDLHLFYFIIVSLTEGCVIFGRTVTFIRANVHPEDHK